ncbi:MAG: hypothetical protein AB7P00_39700, partial [Sandaracinaceae bacterium]
RGTAPCASSRTDCGPCSVRGNLVCETMGGFEDCINCPADCGACSLRACGESLTCVFGCFSFGGGGGGGPPGFDIGCIIDCVALTCPDSRAFLDGVINCSINAFVSGTCMDLPCIMSTCMGEITACLRDRGC